MCFLAVLAILTALTTEERVTWVAPQLSSATCTAQGAQGCSLGAQGCSLGTQGGRLGAHHPSVLLEQPLRSVSVPPGESSWAIVLGIL